MQRADQGGQSKHLMELGLIINSYGYRLALRPRESKNWEIGDANAKLFWEHMWVSPMVLHC